MSRMPSSTRTISQQAFEALVMENIEDLSMDPDEALLDAIETLTIQGVDLSGIVKRVLGVSSANDDPVMQTLDALKSILSSKLDGRKPVVLDDTVDFEGLVSLLDKLYELCESGGSENASIVTKNGGVELLTSLCSAIHDSLERLLVSVFRVLCSILHDVQSTDSFGQSGGPKIVVDILKRSCRNGTVFENGFSVVAAAATGNEVIKESFMELKLDELLVQTLKQQSKSCPQSLFDAIRILLTPDDNRVVASQVYGYAKRFSQLGTADALIEAIRDGLGSTSMVSACSALRALSVNDEICRSISENGGIDILLKCLNDIDGNNNKAVAKTCCSLLSKLAASDDNKVAIIQKDGLYVLMKLSSIFSEDPSVLQEIMSIVAVLSLRFPDHAARAVEAGAGDLAFLAMEKFPTMHLLQRQSCFMIRNLVARNPENRTMLLGYGVEKLIRKAKVSHESCRDAATAALRDLGLDDYNA